MDSPPLGVLERCVDLALGAFFSGEQGGAGLMVLLAGRRSVLLAGLRSVLLAGCRSVFQPEQWYDSRKSSV